MINKCIFIGNAGADANVADMNNGQKVANINLALDQSYTNKNGERVKNTTWVKLVAFGPAVKVASLVKKGAQIYVEAAYRERTYTDNSGVEKTASEFVIDEIRLLGKKSAEDLPQA